MIRLGAAHLAEIRAYARAAYPRECCGLLKGYGGENDAEDIRITAIAPSANVALAEDGAAAFDRFEVDPKVRFDLMRALRDDGETGRKAQRMVGHYHSHPDHPPYPSPRDIEMAFEAELIWLIIAVDAHGAQPPKAFRIDRETRHVEPLTIAIDAD